MTVTIPSRILKGILKQVSQLEEDNEQIQVCPEKQVSGLIIFSERENSFINQLYRTDCYCLCLREKVGRLT